jgi:hypothetical protein
MKKLTVIALMLVLYNASAATSAERVLLEAENFNDIGGWVIDQQFMDQMGSPYLLAHGLGDPVRDAITQMTPPSPGKYRIWVRTRDWVAPWKKTGAPGKFQVLINGKPLDVIFGTEGAEWHWQDGGTIELAGKVQVALHDLMGFEGRCDAILFCKDLNDRPPEDAAALATLRKKLLHLPDEPDDGGRYDLVVVGGGVAGCCAAISAARQGCTVALIQDRPVLGGNGSSEVRVWPEGNIHQLPYPHVGDIVAELVRPKGKTDGNAKVGEIYGDQQKLDVVRAQPNLKLFLGSRVNAVEADKSGVRAVICQNIRTARRTRVAGRWFADCTGDACVGFMAGADFELTRVEHMGASNLWNVKDTGAKEPFPKCLCKDFDPLASSVKESTKAAPFPRCPWAVDLSDKAFPGRKKSAGQWSSPGLNSLGAWYWESGFDHDPITEVEWMRDLNLRAMYGAWDTLKNVDGLYPNHRLAWAAYIAGKRESRRLLGDVQVTVEDFRTGRYYEDACFPCTWSIDLHDPEPKYQKGHEGSEFIARATTGKKYQYAGPYWAPYRALYSRNIPNLFMAGRDISVTHEALGPVRVMQTCGMMGEVVGMAAGLCKRFGCQPRGVYAKHLAQLQQLLRGERTTTAK